MREDGLGILMTLLLSKMDSQFDDCPISVSELAAALGFPTIAHVLPCVFHSVNDRTVTACSVL